MNLETAIANLEQAFGLLEKVRENYKPNFPEWMDTDIETFDDQLARAIDNTHDCLQDLQDLKEEIESDTPT